VGKTGPVGEQGVHDVGYVANGKHRVKIKASLNGYNVLKRADAGLVAGRIDELLGYLEEQPKSLTWKSRAKMGTRLKWYEEVDDWYVM
jgi:hypothetical protein